MQDGMWGNGKAMRTFFSQYDASQVDVWMADRISIYKLGFRDHPFQKLDMIEIISKDKKEVYSNHLVSSAGGVFCAWYIGHV